MFRGTRRAFISLSRKVQKRAVFALLGGIPRGSRFPPGNVLKFEAGHGVPWQRVVTWPSHLEILFAVSWSISLLLMTA